ncbi:DsrE family protein [Azospirillum sp. ST 5-10]|uniref:DsrE family protein n=1 Tax=unclassified Azospirillum TaxID=2630922 RepID=UPI003F49BA74
MKGRRRLWATLCLAATLASGPAFADTTLADPPPSVDQPRRILLQLTSDDPREMNNLLHNVVNLQKFYEQDRVRIVVVAFGAGMQAFYRDSSPVADRVRSLLHYDVAFVGCGNTMAATHRTPDELIEGVQVVTAGVAEIVERQLQGWVYVRP